MNPRTLERLCGEQRKVRFVSRLDALMALALRQRRDKGERRVYRCPHCGFWHLTSNR